MSWPTKKFQRFMQSLFPALYNCSAVKWWPSTSKCQVSIDVVASADRVVLVAADGIKSSRLLWWWYCIFRWCVDVVSDSCWINPFPKCPFVLSKPSYAMMHDGDVHFVGWVEGPWAMVNSVKAIRVGVRLWKSLVMPKVNHFLCASKALALELRRVRSQSR